MDSNTSSVGTDEPRGNNGLLAVAVIFSVLWTLFCLLLWPKIQGSVLTVFLRLAFKNAYISIGSIRLCPLAGCVFFKNVVYADEDNSFRALDGYISVPWWIRPKAYPDPSRTRSKIKSNLFTIKLNGFHYHWYNRDEAYRILEEKYKGTFVPREDSGTENRSRFLWYDYISVVQVLLTKGSLVFGNSNVPHSLVVLFDDASATHTVSAPYNPLDLRLYTTVFEGINMNAYLQKSAGYEKPVEEPPVSDERGFLFAESNRATFTYSTDVPGVNENDEFQMPGPRFLFSIDVGAETKINYGPWAHRQRFYLQRLFVPHDYMEEPVTVLPTAGQKRIFTNLDVVLSAPHGAELNILFREGTNVSNLKLKADKESHIVINQPWITNMDGYTSVLKGVITSPQFTTSLPYSQAANGHSLQLNVKLHFPRRWNELQKWDMQFSAEKVLCTIMIHYVDFFDALLRDWWGDDPSDFQFFVPLKWTVGFSVKNYEIFVPTNRYNWMDVSPRQMENSSLAFCGESGQLSFDFPLMEFMPLEQNVLFQAQGENLVLRKYLPPSCSTKQSVFSLSSANRKRWRWLDSHTGTDSSLHCNVTDSDHERFPIGCCISTHYEDGWLDLGAGGGITIEAHYVSKRNDDLDRKIPQGITPPPNTVSVAIVIDKPILRVFGSLGKEILAIKENFVGDYPYLNTFNSEIPDGVIVRNDIPEFVVPEAPTPVSQEKSSNVFLERFLNIHVDFKITNVTAEFPLHPTDLNDEAVPLPSVYCSCFNLLVDYELEGTHITLKINDLSLFVPGKLRADSDLGQVGSVCFPGIELQAQGYTEPLHHERVEYAWMIAVSAQDISGAIGIHQVPLVLEWFESAVLHAVSPGDSTIEAPGACVIAPKVEPLAEELKYKLLNVYLSSIQLDLFSESSHLLIQTPGFSLHICNLQTEGYGLSVSCSLPALQIQALSSCADELVLYEVANATLRDLNIEARIRDELFVQRQIDFIKTGDRRTQRLWFMWPKVFPGASKPSSCGCERGCQFTSAFQKEVLSRGILHWSSQQNATLSAGSGDTALGLQNVSDLAKLHFWLFNIHDKESLKDDSSINASFQSLSHPADVLDKRWSSPSMESFYSVQSHVSEKGEDKVDGQSLGRGGTKDSFQYLPSFESLHYSASVLVGLPSGINNVGSISSVKYQQRNRGVLPNVKVSKRQKVSGKRGPTSDQSKVLLSIKLMESLTMSFSPEGIGVVESFVQAFGNALASQAPLSCLNLDMLLTVLGLSSLLSDDKSTEGITTDGSETSAAPLLCVSASTHQDAFCAIQLNGHNTTTTGVNAATLFATGLKIGVLVQPAPPRAQHSMISSDEMNSEAFSVAVSVSIPTMQMDFSTVQSGTHHGNSKQPQISSNLLFQLEAPENYTSMPLFQLSVDKIGANSVACMKKSRSGSPTVTFTDVLADEPKDKVFHRSSESNVSLFLSIGEIKTQFVHSLSSYPNVIEELNSTVSQFSAIPALAKSAQRVVESVSTSRTRGLYQLLFSATSHSDRILPKVVCVHSKQTKSLRDTAIYQCLQQLSAVTEEVSSNLPHVEEQVDEDVITSLAAALSAKLAIMSRSKSTHKRLWHDASARRVSVHSLQSQASIHISSTTERSTAPGAGRVPLRPETSSNMYRKFFQKLGCSKLTRLSESLSPWLPLYFKTRISSESYTSFSVNVSLPCLALVLHVPSLLSPVPFVEVNKVDIGVSGKLANSLPLANLTKLKVSAQVCVKIDNVGVCVDEIFDRFLSITVLQILKSSKDNGHNVQPPTTELPTDTKKGASQDLNLDSVASATQPNNEFLYSISKYYKEALMHEDTPLNLVRPASPNVLILQSPQADPIFNAHAGSQEDLVPLVSSNDLLFSPSSGIGNPAFLMSPGPGLQLSPEKVSDASVNSSSDFDVAVFTYIGNIGIMAKLGTLKAKLQLERISFSCLVRVLLNGTSETNVIKKLSLSSSFGMKKVLLELIDEGWNPSVLLRLSIPDSLLLVSVICQDQCVKQYRIIAQFPSFDFDLKQPPVIIQKVVHLHLPSFRALYRDIEPFLDLEPNVSASLPGRRQKLDFTKLNELMKAIGQGSCLIVVQRVSLLVTALPSLTLMYYGSSFIGHLESNQDISISFSCSSHNLKFTPRVHLEDISVRDVYLPSFDVGATLIPREHGAFPGASLYFHIDKIEVHLSTDILNQLLVVQSSFVKELDETVAILGEIRHAVPVRGETKTTKTPPEKQPGVAEPSDVLMAALQTLQVSVQGVDITISTPSQTAIRLTAGKVEVLISNVQSASREYLLCLLGKVDIDVHAALGFFQDCTDDLDAFNELAEFSTRLSIRDTSQISDSGSDDQDLTPLDTYSLTIHSPHLFIQSAAVEKGLTFWLYCKIAYSYWQDQRKALQDEVQSATESLLQRIHRRAESNVPKLDFARPKLVQITVTDLGICFPLTANPIISDMRPRAMPAAVVTIHEMKITINVRKKIAIAGSFAGFCARFSEWFTARQKHWSVDFRKREVDNCATVPKGTCKICIGIKSSPGSHRIRLIWSLQWEMSGIDIHAKHDIGVHISSLVRTIFSVSGDIDRAERIPTHGASGPSVTISKPQNVLERNLGFQAHRVQNLKQHGFEYSKELSTLKQMERVALQSMRSGSKSGPSRAHRMSVLMDWSRPTLLKVMREPQSRHSSATGGHRRAHSEIHKRDVEKAVISPPTGNVENLERLTSEEYGSPGTMASGEDYSIDLDINVTVSIARGSIALHSSALPMGSEYSSPVIPRRGLSDNTAMFWSPGPTGRFHRSKETAGPSVPGTTTKVLIPAVSVKGNYSSDVVKGFGDETTSLDSFSDNQHREGKLMLSVSVESLEKPVTLNPSLPVFVEQVVRPISSTLDLSSQQNVSADTNSSEENSDTSSITIAETSAFPIHVFVHFHLKPSTIILSCDPISRVHCEICIPDVRVACSFSLFTAKDMDSSLTNVSEPQTSTINDLSVTGCLSAFSIAIISPQASSSVLQKLQKTSATKGPRCVFSLKLGLASIHLSRKTFIAETNGIVHDKQYISIAADVASVLLAFDIRQLNNATAFRKCWYRKSITESILFGPGTSRNDSEAKPVDGGNPLSASIVVAANITDLTFSSNLAQVMGDAGIVLTHFGIRSHADILENELVQLTVKAFISQVNADARGGVVAGVMNLSNAQIGLNTCSYEGKKPIHDAFAQVQSIDCRVDYMGASQLMAKATGVNFHFCEEWKGSVLDTDSMGFPGVKVIISFNWDVIKLIICQSTTRAIVNIASRLSEFVLQQKSRSEKTLLTMLPAAASRQNPLQSLLGVKPDQDNTDGLAKHSDSAKSENTGFLKYHHWLWATHERSCSLLLALGIYSPEATESMSLGGEVHVSGGSVSLACLHGSSFIEKEWAVFNLHSLAAAYVTQAIPCLAEDSGRKQSVASLEEQTRICQQQLCLSLQSTERCECTKPFAGIYKVTSGRAGIPLLSSNTNMDDWLSYRCIDSFFLGEDIESSQKPAVKLGRRITVEPILSLPSFTFSLTNDHFWPSSDSLLEPGHPVPLVKCHLKTTFKDGISITTSAHRYDFLHTLITSYIDYLEDKGSGVAGKSKPPFDRGGLDLNCGRKFVCETWELDPSLVLIAGEMWPSGKINPRINLLLDWLGFKEAKVTIPKWVQRGAMDPIDMLFSKLLQSILVVSARKKTPE